jgi:hypothetical protein
MAQSPCFYSPCWFPVVSLPFPFTYLETLLWRDAIPSTLAPGYSWTDLPLSIPSPFPPHPKFPTPWGFPELNMRLTKTTSRFRLTRSGTVSSSNKRHDPTKGIFYNKFKFQIYIFWKSLFSIASIIFFFVKIGLTRQSYVSIRNNLKMLRKWSDKMIEKAEGKSFKVSRPPLAYFSKPCLGYGGSCCLINQVGHVTCLLLYPGGGESHTTPRPFPQQRIGSSPDKWEDFAFLKDYKI